MYNLISFDEYIYLCILYVIKIQNIPITPEGPLVPILSYLPLSFY